MSKHYSSNDMRSITMNPNNPAYTAAMNNRAETLNSNNTTLDHNNDAYKAAQDNHSRQIQAASESEK